MTQEERLASLEAEVAKLRRALMQLAVTYDRNFRILSGKRRADAFDVINDLIGF